MKVFKASFTLLLLCTAFFGDYVVFNSKYSTSEVFRALADTSLHGLIGGLSSIIFFTYDHDLGVQAYISHIILCTVVSSFIDIDHVLAARSLQWKDIRNVNRRGIFHSTTFWIVIITPILIYSYLKKRNTIYTIAYMLIIASLSHHIRDGNRRGLWFPPYGSTPPLNNFLYYTLSAVLPHILAMIYNYTKPSMYRILVSENVIV